MIELTTGEVLTTGKGTFSIYAFYKRDAKTREMPLHEAEKDDRSGIPKSEKIQEVILSGLPLHKKSWTTRRHTYPSGSYIKFVMKRTNPSSPGVFQRAVMSAMYIAVRDTAPLNLVTIDLPFDNNSSKPRLYINGRFDVLTAEQVKERGLNINAQGSDEDYLFETHDDDHNVYVEMQEKGLTPKAPPKLKQMSPGKAVPKLRRARKVGLVD